MDDFQLILALAEAIRDARRDGDERKFRRLYAALSVEESHPSGWRANPENQDNTAKVQITALVPENLRGRARAAFKNASYYEDVPSFSEFVANALDAEIRRLESVYNNGTEFEPVTNYLPRGRTVR